MKFSLNRIFYSEKEGEINFCFLMCYELHKNSVMHYIKTDIPEAKVKYFDIELSNLFIVVFKELYFEKN